MSKPTIVQGEDTVFGRRYVCLTDHERLQAEAERLQAERAADKYLIDQLYRQRDDYAMHNMAVRQCTGIPRSVGISEPVEGFEDRPQDLAPAMREMALIIEADKARIAELEKVLEEAAYRIDQHKVWVGMGYEYTGVPGFEQRIISNKLRAALAHQSGGAK